MPMAEVSWPVPSLFQRKSWKRRYFVLDEFSISYFKYEQVSSLPGSRPDPPPLEHCASGRNPQGGRGREET